MSCLNVRKGLGASMTPEAALVVPVMVIVILPFLFLFRVLLCQSVFETALQNLSMEMATECYLLQRMGVIPEATEEPYRYTISESSGKSSDLSHMMETMKATFEMGDPEDVIQEAIVDLIGEWVVKQQLESRLSSIDLASLGLSERWNSISTAGSRFFYDEDTHHYLLRMEVTIDYPSPVSFWKMPQGHVVRTIHVFMGEKGGEASHNAKEEDSREEETVYRIGAGIHYHQLSCYLIGKSVSTISIDTANARGLSPCSRCLGGSLTTVYITEGGTHYHNDHCVYLFPNVTALTKEEATGLGLTPCGLCFGGAGELFSH